eukprot:NODE_2452_length_2210_cov_5.148344.p1 GENE.NODE_2452_length_2210_cov_5.148344~~NODE_2452_length_2210_cov_5.148344.p1  ORF type:complete len:593 (-),score=101.08 NODE_2452_length_2210_cov_5.148344:432-2183(-)
MPPFADLALSSAGEMVTLTGTEDCEVAVANGRIASVIPRNGVLDDRVDDNIKRMLPCTQRVCCSCVNSQMTPALLRTDMVQVGAGQVATPTTKGRDMSTGVFCDGASTATLTDCTYSPMASIGDADELTSTDSDAAALPDADMDTSSAGQMKTMTAMVTRNNVHCGVVQEASPSRFIGGHMASGVHRNGTLEIGRPAMPSSEVVSNPIEPAALNAGMQGGGAYPTSTPTCILPPAEAIRQAGECAALTHHAADVAVDSRGRAWPVIVKNTFLSAVADVAPSAKRAEPWCPNQDMMTAAWLDWADAPVSCAVDSCEEKLVCGGQAISIRASLRLTDAIAVAPPLLELPGNMLSHIAEFVGIYFLRTALTNRAWYGLALALRQREAAQQKDSLNLCSRGLDCPARVPGLCAFGSACNRGNNKCNFCHCTCPRDDSMPKKSRHGQKIRRKTGLPAIGQKNHPSSQEWPPHRRNDPKRRESFTRLQPATEQAWPEWHSSAASGGVAGWSQHLEPALAIGSCWRPTSQAAACNARSQYSRRCALAGEALSFRKNLAGSRLSVACAVQPTACSLHGALVFGWGRCPLLA